MTKKVVMEDPLIGSKTNLVSSYASRTNKSSEFNSRECREELNDGAFTDSIDPLIGSKTNLVSSYASRTKKASELNSTEFQGELNDGAFTDSISNASGATEVWTDSLPPLKRR